MQNIYRVCGVHIRVTDVVPVEVIGVNNGRYLSLFWQGAEIGRINPAPNNCVQADGACVHAYLSTDGIYCYDCRSVVAFTPRR